MNRFDRGTTWGQPAAQRPDIEVESPARGAGLVADWLVPFLQAMTSGALFGGFVALVVAQTNYRGNLGALFLGVTLFVAALAWLVLLRDSRRLLWSLERLTGWDLDRDQQVGKPEERLVFLNAGQGQQQAHQQRLGQERSEFVRFVRRLDAFGTSQRSWEPQIGREQYVRFRDALLRLGWAEWNSLDQDGQPHERQGWSLTLPAAEIVAKISE